MRILSPDAVVALQHWLQTVCQPLKNQLSI